MGFFGVPLSGRGFRFFAPGGRPTRPGTLILAAEPLAGVLASNDRAIGVVPLVPVILLSITGRSLWTNREKPESLSDVRITPPWELVLLL